MVGVHAVRQHDQHVHVGIREQLATPITSHGHERAAFGHGRLIPKRLELPVDMRGQLAQQAPRSRDVGLGGAEGFNQRLLAGLESLALLGEQGRVHPVMKAGGGGLPADSVMIS